jgi:oxygen-independent coproporphyrinogen-3 oxidase
MLRRTQLGLDRADFSRRTGIEFDRLAGPVLERYVGQGLLEDSGSIVRFTREGLFLADTVLCELV